MTRREWEACEDGAVMLALLAEASGGPGGDGRRRLVLAACECARLALRCVPTGETRPLAAIEVAERWARREKVMLQEVHNAADGASAAYAAAVASADAAGDASSSDVFVAAADAADAAVRAAGMAFVAADIGARAAAVAHAAGCASRADHSRALRQCAEILRRHYPEPPGG